MTPEMFVALMNSVAFLGMKNVKTKEETLAYDHLLAYAGSISRFNTIVVNQEIRKLDEEYPDVNRNSRSTQRVA